MRAAVPAAARAAVHQVPRGAAVEVSRVVAGCRKGPAHAAAEDPRPHRADASKRSQMLSTHRVSVFLLIPLLASCGPAEQLVACVDSTGRIVGVTIVEFN